MWSDKCLYDLNLTSGTSLFEKQLSHTHSAYISWVSRWNAVSARPVHTRWNQKLQPDSHRIA